MTTTQSISDIWRGTLKEVTVLSDEMARRYSQNITEYAELEIPAVLKPQNLAEVQKIVECANRLRLPLFPISTGKNWGQGSKLPLQPGQTIVELSEMNQIREINECLRYVIIEPGVTQKQLADALAGTPWMIPMTGSGEDTSVVGNLLERGATAFTHRNDLVLGWEVVLGKGDTVRTGFWHFMEAEPVLGLYHAPGVGPDMNGLFTQSNFGIITAVALQLLPKQDGTIYLLETKEDQLSELITAVNKLMDDGIIEKWAFISNKNDPRTTPANQFDYTGEWVCALVSKGIPEMRQLAAKQVKTRLSEHCHLFFTFETNTPDHLLPGEYPPVIKKLWYGVPTNYSLEKMVSMTELGAKNGNIDIDTNKSMPGFSVALPALPFEGGILTDALSIAKKIAENWKVQGFYNFTFLGGRVLEGYFRVYFDRNDPAKVAAAHGWNEHLNWALEAIGLYPYRLNNQMMPYFFNRPQDGFARTLAALKAALDPNEIIAPGKYCPGFTYNVH